MATEKLYYVNQYRTEFTAEVRSCEAEKGHWAVILDRSCFYPEGGGQPGDTGYLDGVRVFDTHERDGEIVHYCEAPVSGTVQGRIDWAHRFDLMQQHSGEHLVSGFTHQFFGYDNVGFHMGSDVITIDFNGPLTPADLERIELAANEAVWKNLRTDIFYPTPEELAALPYRSKKVLTGEVRIVRWEGVDTCACCGTHVAYAGEIGIIKLLSCVTFRDGVRVELVCGKRAYDYLSVVHGQNREISGLLSAKPVQTAAAAARMAAELADTKYALGLWQRKYFAEKAASLNGKSCAPLFEDGLTPDGVRQMTVELMEHTAEVCAVFSGTDETGYKYAVGQTGGDLRQFVRQLNAALQGRGGGKPFFAQGSVSASRDEIRRFFAGEQA